jgi:hypothetical protein
LGHSLRIKQPGGAAAALRASYTDAQAFDDWFADSPGGDR